MASGASSPVPSSAHYHPYPADPDHGPPAYPGNAAGVSSVEVDVEPRERGTNGEVNISVCRCGLFIDEICQILT